MTQGTDMIKVYSKAGKIQKRKFFLSDDMQYVTWSLSDTATTPSKNSKNRIWLTSVKEIRFGELSLKH